MKPIANNKPSYIQALFTAIARRYDLLNTLLSFSRDGAWRRFAVSKCSLPPGGLALDVATGTGEMARLLAQRRGGGRVVGVDSCAAMLDRARIKLMASDGTKINLLLGDALRLPFPDNKFDCVTIAFALRNVADVAATFREMARVVKPGGNVVSLELTRPPSRLVRAVYYFYIFRIAPYIGGLVSGRKEAYVYLPESISEFRSPEEVGEIMEEAGLREVEIHRLALGTATVHAGVKAGR